MKQKLQKYFCLLLLGLVSMGAYSQDLSDQRTITGYVTDSEGEPIPGVSVFVKGTDNGTVTNFDGQYSIRAFGTDVLVFSYIGMKTIEKTVGSESNVDVVLEMGQEQLDDVVVVGYGTQRREEITGSVETVNMEEIEDLPVGSLGSALVGRVLGVQFDGGQERPGSGTRIQIRNPNNFAKDGGTNEPLFVIDGVLQVDADTGYNDASLFNSLDASEVESISFLKDAAAAIYGARGAQGVVIVTTKRGQEGPARLRYSGNYAVADESYRTDVMDAYEYGLYFNIMNGPNGANRDAADANRQYFFTQAELDHFRTLNYTPLDDQWSSATTQRHNLNVSGGSDNATYFAGISYYTQEGNLGTQDFDRWSFRSSADAKIANGLTAGIQVSGNFDKRLNSFTKMDAENADYGQLLNKVPFLPDYIDGNPVQILGANQNAAHFHFPEIMRMNNLAENKGNRIGVNLNAKYEVPFIPGLSFSASYARSESKNRGTQMGNTFDLYQYNGPDEINEYRYIYYPSGTGPLGTNTFNRINTQTRSNRLFIENDTRTTEQINGNVAYNLNVGRHDISAMFAVERGESWFFKDRINKEGVQEYSNGQVWSANGDLSNTFSWADETGDLGYVGRLNYGYDAKYFAEFLYRSSASAKFAPQNYWGDFYSVSAGWIVSRESFWNSNTFDYLKIRGSWGLLGKDNIKQWQWLQRFSVRPGNGAVFGWDENTTDGLRMGTSANFDVRWSKEIKMNLGFETRMLDNRLSLTAESYYNIGSDIQVGLTKGVPFTVGAQVPAQNFAEQDTWGTEISVGWDDRIGEDFRYGVTVNTNWYNSKMTKGDFPEDLNTLRPWDRKPGDTDTDMHRWGYDFQGMFRTQEEANQWVIENQIAEMFELQTGYDPETGTFDPSANELRPGMLYYSDVHGDWNNETGSFEGPDGIIDEDDQVILRKARKGPQGFSSVIRLGWKNFNLNTVLQVGWNNYYEIDGAARSRVPRDQIQQNYENRPAIWGDIYDPVLNPTGTMPNPYHRDVYDRSSSFWRVGNSMSYVVRNINLSYNVPQDLTERLGLSNASLNVVGLNPFTIYNPYEEYGLPAPEHGSYGTGGAYPTLRTWSLGLSVGF